MPPVSFLPDMIVRIAAMCDEAIPENRAVLDYLLGDYANYPHWRVGDRDLTPSIQITESLHLDVEVLARLYVGKIAAGYKGYSGDAEHQSRTLGERAVQYFANHLRLTSTAYPTGMNYMQAKGLVFNRPRKVIDNTSDKGWILYIEYTWTVPIRVPRELRS